MMKAGLNDGGVRDKQADFTDYGEKCSGDCEESVRRDRFAKSMHC